MPDTPSITIVKSFVYRDQPEEWSNTYHFTGDTPADAAAWRTLALAIWNTEKACMTSQHTIVAGYGYEAGNEHSVAQLDFTAPVPAGPVGTLPQDGSSTPWAGDQAGWIRAYIKQSSTGKKVYIRKYFHGGRGAVADPDELAASTRAAYLTHAQKLLDGTLPGGFEWSGPQAEAATLPDTSRYVTTRTLKRRGRRP